MVRSGAMTMQTSVYSSVSAEYVAATEGVGLADRSQLGRLKVSGADAIDLLNRLSTNKLDDLAVGDVQGTVLTTNKGRIIDLLYVLRRDDYLLVITGAQTRGRVAEWIDFYTFIEDVEVEDVSEETVMLSILGHKATAALPQLSEVPLYGSAGFTSGEIDVLALRTDFLGCEGYDLIVPSEQAPGLWDALIHDAGMGKVDAPELEFIRISNGMAGYGSELIEDYNPLEAGLIDFISFNKGCYIGQEVVARLNTYDKVQKHLVRLSWNGDESPDLPAALILEDKQVGTLTSSTNVFHNDEYIGLGYLRKGYFQDGARLLTEDGLDVMVEGIARPKKA